MNNIIARHLLFIWILATIMLFVVQYFFDHHINPDVLTYLLPGCTVSYIFGRVDVLREIGKKKDSKNE